MHPTQIVMLLSTAFKELTVVQEQLALQVTTAHKLQVGQHHALPVLMANIPAVMIPQTAQHAQEVTTAHHLH
jgi:hypothetical protein